MIMPIESSVASGTIRVNKPKTGERNAFLADDTLWQQLFKAVTKAFKKLALSIKNRSI